MRCDRAITLGKGPIIFDELGPHKHQLLIMKRSRRRGPKLTAWDRLILGFCTLLVSPRRWRTAAVVVKTSTLLRLHRAGPSRLRNAELDEAAVDFRRALDCARSTGERNFFVRRLAEAKLDDYGRR